MLNVTTKEKYYNNKDNLKCFDNKEGYVMFYKGEFVSGKLGKSSIKDSKEGLIYKIIKLSGH